MRRLLPLGIAALLLPALACGRERAATPPLARPVVVSAVRPLDVEDRIESTGQLLAKEHAEIAAEVAGRITQIRVEEGASVRAGEVVVEIDPERRRLAVEDARAGLAEAVASLHEQERQTARLQELRRRAVASQAKLEEAQTALSLARSRVDAARANLGLAERALRDAGVSAPFDGLLARRLVSRGEYVSEGKPLFELVALSPIEVEFHLAEVDSARVAVGRPVDVRVAPFPDESFAARVTVVSPTLDPRTRTLRVKAQLDNADGRLRPGLFARVDLGVAKRSGVLFVPEEAVLQRADGSVVFVVGAESRAQRRLVETGAHRDGTVEVVRGLAAGERVVVRGHAELVDGAVVTPQEAGDAGSDAPLAAASGAETP